MTVNGWLKPILEQAVTDRESWPFWERGLEIETDDSVKVSRTHPACGETQLDEEDISVVEGDLNKSLKE